jgi:osmotically-inducible protein OsmY
MSAAATSVLDPVGLDKERIREALVLAALGDERTIHVETDGTEITLTGAVSSFAEFNRAGHAAWSVPGVTKVDNRLRVV